MPEWALDALRLRYASVFALVRLRAISCMAERINYGSAKYEDERLVIASLGAMLAAVLRFSRR
jgi:hypothetical protein